MVVRWSTISTMVHAATSFSKYLTPWGLSEWARSIGPHVERRSMDRKNDRPQMNVCQDTNVLGAPVAKLVPDGPPTKSHYRDEFAVSVDPVATTRGCRPDAVSR